MASAVLTKAHILARLGDMARATVLAQSLMDGEAIYKHNEIFSEAADLFDTFGSRESALAILDRVPHQTALTTSDRRLLALTKAKLYLRNRDFEMAAVALDDYPPVLSTVVGQPANLQMTAAYLKVSRGDPGRQGRRARD